MVKLSTALWFRNYVLQKEQERKVKNDELNFLYWQILKLINYYKSNMIIDALLLKQMPKKQTGFVLLLKQNKSDLVFHHQNYNKSN